MYSLKGVSASATSFGFIARKRIFASVSNFFIMSTFDTVFLCSSCNLVSLERLLTVICSPLTTFACNKPPIIASAIEPAPRKKCFE